MNVWNVVNMKTQRKTSGSQLNLHSANLPFMQLDAPVPAQWIAEFIGAKLTGDASQMATGLNEIHKVQPGDISFVDFEKYYNTCLSSPATVIIINKEVEAPQGKTLLVCNDPFSAY